MPVLRRYKWTDWALAQLGPGPSGPDTVAIDTETSGLAFHDEAFCVTLTWRTPGGDLRSAYVDVDRDEEGYRERRALVRQFIAQAPTWVFHNAKFDLQKLELGNMLPPMKHRRLHDTQVIFNLMNENERKALKILAKTVLGEETDEDEKLKVIRRKLKLTKDDGYHLIPRRYIIPYAMKDTEFTLRLYEVLWPRFQKLVEKDPQLAVVYEEEIRVSEVLRRWEANGIKVDVPYLTKTTDEYSIKVMEGYTRIQTVSGVTDPKFANSPKQLKEAFAARGHDLPDTTEATIRGLAEAGDELAETLLQFRSDQKMHKTYLRNILDEQVDGVIHPWFNPTGARTGRMSSGSAAA